MPTSIQAIRFYKILLVFALLISGVACGPRAASTPVVRVETVVQTAEVTREVTRIVELPVTITPSSTPAISLTPSLTPTITQTPTITPTPLPPIVSILELSNCRFGPGAAYLYKYALNETVRMEVVGQNLDSSWLFVQGFNHQNP
jgi:hypothetical protein